MWGRERVKVEETVGKLSQHALFSKFRSEFLYPRKTFGPKNVIKGLPAI